jgi:hypothetical protein
MEGEQRIHLAEAFLAEAVFASRARQAASASLTAGGGCGLGERAERSLDLSARGAELARELWPRELTSAETSSIRATLAQWVGEQDALDRKRNHFLKDFRQRHGFDRARYTPEQLARFEQGLDRINAEGDELRRAAAQLLP